VQTRLTFDYTSPDLAGPRYWDAVRQLQVGGPLVWVESKGGFWAATSHAMVLRVLQDWQTFSSAEGIFHPRPGPDVMPYTMPIDFDPPRQRPYRKQVNPYLAPAAVLGFEEQIRDIADELIDGFIDRGSCDLCVDFARKFPGTVFFRIVAGSDDTEFRTVEPEARTVAFTDDQGERARAATQIRAWASRMFELRSGQPERNDIVDAVMHLRATGAPFSDDDLLSGLALLAQGGIGTSSSSIASIMLLLCKHPDVQQRARDDRTAVPAVVEEALRLEPPLSMVFRTVTCDVEVAGQQLQEGQKVCVLFGAANRDAAVFDRPDEFDIDRARNRHLTFSGGPHRCIGSNLARLQIQVATEQLLTRLGPFRIPDGEVPGYAPPNQARSLSSLPLEFSAGK
jgi:cytochrome P450